MQSGDLSLQDRDGSSRVETMKLVRLNLTIPENESIDKVWKIVLAWEVFIRNENKLILLKIKRILKLLAKIKKILNSVIESQKKKKSKIK